MIGFGRPVEDRTLTGGGFSYVFGGTTSARAVTERSAMQLAVVYSCVRVLAEAIAGLPLHVYRTASNGGKEKAVDHPLYWLLHDEPNPEMTSFVFREVLMTQLLIWGNAYAQVIRNGRYDVIGLNPLMPDLMTVGRDEAGRLYYEYQRTPDDPTARFETVRLDRSEVLHIPGLGFDGLVGHSPIIMAKNAIGMAQACEDYGASFFANGTAPPAVCWSIAGIGMGLVYLDTMNIFFEDPDQPDGIEIEEMASSSVIVESLASTMFVPLVASLISLAFASGQSFSTIPYGISWILVVVLAFASLAYLKRAMPAGGNTRSSSV